MHRSLLRHHVQKEILFERNIYRTDNEQSSLNKLTKLISSDVEKNCWKSFFDTSSSSNIEEEIIKQINMLKPFDMEPRKAISKKPFVSKEKSNHEEEINLTPQGRIGNINWCKC